MLQRASVVGLGTGGERASIHAPIVSLSGSLALWLSSSLALWLSSSLALWLSGSLALWLSCHAVRSVEMHDHQRAPSPIVIG